VQTLIKDMCVSNPRFISGRISTFAVRMLPRASETLGAE
jgi:hypothetical protein